MFRIVSDLAAIVQSIQRTQIQVFKVWKRLVTLAYVPIAPQKTLLHTDQSNRLSRYRLFTLIYGPTSLYGRAIQVAARGPHPARKASQTGPPALVAFKDPYNHLPLFSCFLFLDQFL